MRDSETATSDRVIDAAKPACAVAHVFPGFSYGGQQARLAALVRGLGPEYRHHVIALDGSLSARALFDKNAQAEFSTFPMKKSAGFSPSNIFELRTLLGRLMPDILCTYNWGAIEAVIANRLGPKAPHLHFEDGFGPGENQLRQSPKRVLARRYILCASTLVVPSHGLEKAAADLWKLSPQRIRRIENGIDFDQMQTGRRGHSDAIVVGALGALRPEKNYGRLIAGFQAADREHRARLEIFGDGPERARLLALAGDDERISLPGATATPADAYARFDIFALSSDTEQAPLSLMEAMAAGLPVAATNVGDIAQMVSPENRASITPLGDDEAYAHALAQLLQNPNARAQIGAANRRKAKADYSSGRMVEQYRALFAEMVGRHD